MKQMQIGFRIFFAGILMLLIGLAYGVPLIARAIHNDNDAFVALVLAWCVLSVGICLLGVVRVMLSLCWQLKNQQKRGES